MTIRDSSRSSGPPASTLSGWLVEQAIRHGERHALRHKCLGAWRLLTWRDLAQQVEALASGLESLGFGRGDTLLLLGQPREATLLLSLAALWRGGVAAPVEPLIADSALTALVARLSPRLSFADGDWQLDRLLAQSQRVIDANPRQLKAHPDERVIDFDTLARREPCAPLAHPADDAFVFHTGMVETRLTHATLIRDAQRLVATEQLDARDDALAALAFDTPAHARFLIAPWLLAGFRLNLPESRETHDTDRREIAPTLVVGSRQSYGCVAKQVDLRLPAAGSPVRRLLAAAANRSTVWPLRLIGWWGVARPLRSVLGLRRTRAALVIGTRLDAETTALFHALRIDIHAWPESEGLHASAHEAVARPSADRLGQPA
jgi:long-subunit acyl-CoA synthetase (AMP-forming)